MRVLLDTDILLDVALRRARFLENSAAALQWAESEPGQAAVAWHSLSNISDLLRPDARPFIRELLEFVEVPPTGTNAAQQAALYARNGIEEYWVVNIIDRVLEVHCEPSRRPRPGYRSVRTFGADEHVTPLAAPSARIRVADLLP